MPAQQRTEPHNVVTSQVGGNDKKTEKKIDKTTKKHSNHLWQPHDLLTFRLSPAYLKRASHIWKIISIVVQCNCLNSQSQQTHV